MPLTGGTAVGRGGFAMSKSYVRQSRIFWAIGAIANGAPNNHAKRKIVLKGTFSREILATSAIADECLLSSWCIGMRQPAEQFCANSSMLIGMVMIDSSAAADVIRCITGGAEVYLFHVWG